MSPLVPTGYDVVWSALVLAAWLVTVGLLAGGAGLAGRALAPPGHGEPEGRARLRRREATALAAATTAGLLLPLPLVLLLGLVTTSVAAAALTYSVVLVVVLASSADGSTVRTADLSAAGPPLPRTRLLAVAPVVAAGVLALVGLGTWLFPPRLQVVTLDQLGMSDPQELFAQVEPLPRSQDVVVALVAVAVLAAGSAAAAWWSRNHPLGVPGGAPHPSVVASARQRVRFRLRRAVAAGTLLVAGLELALGHSSLRLVDGVASRDDWQAAVGALGLLLLLGGCVLLALRPPPLVLASGTSTGAGPSPGRTHPGG
ncbi:hypothetical protein [Aquipuribacter sp. MA13-6]|uniref:hypothetical protein n=1 Tax=unclassified Aquipuribacter TaxID=2635084 RepID=UPI003EEAE147